MTYEAVCNHAEWHAKNKGRYAWVIVGGEMDGTFFTTHMPQLIDEYDGHLELWWWNDNDAS